VAADARDRGMAQRGRFGAYLRSVREDRRLSLDSVEELTVGYPERITKSHLSRIETGQAVPTFPRLFALSQIYGVSISSLAERFEIELRRGMMSDLQDQNDDEVVAKGREHRLCGRYAEALICFEAVLDRWRAAQADSPSDDPAVGDRVLALRIERATCLVQLRRYVVAKEEAEDLLGQDLDPLRNATVLELFAISCYRLGKFTVALLALDSVDEDLEKIAAGPHPSETARRVAASLVTIRANLLAATGREREAIPMYKRAAELFEAVPSVFEACRARINLTSAQITIGQYKSARRTLLRMLQHTQERGFERQTALVHSNLAVIAFHEGDPGAAEAHCLRSNAIARPRDYTSVVFRNCYYLWRIAAQSADGAGSKVHERALRTYLGRLTDPLPEADEFRKHLARSESC
jgi:tetratricopeptide (TPR) repeat protein